MSDVKIKLGGEEFDVAAPPLGRLVEFVEAVDTIGQSGFTTKVGYDAVMAILRLGLTVKSKDVLDRLDDLPVTLQELRDAVQAILQASGLHQGEAEAQQNPSVTDPYMS